MGNCEFATTEKVGEGLFVCVSKNHRFGTDSVLLANFSSAKNKDLVCDLGTGCGIIPILLHKYYNPRKIYAIDIQKSAVELAKQSVKISGLEDKITVKNSDLKSASDLPESFFDLVVCNPPYKALGSGVASKTKSDLIARHEYLCCMEDVCFAAKRLLKFGGRLCMSQRTERLPDTICAMRKFNIEPKLIRFCAKNKDSSPWMFLIEGRKGGGRFLKVLPVLSIYEQSGEFSKEVKKIYSAGGKF